MKTKETHLGGYGDGYGNWDGNGDGLGYWYYTNCGIGLRFIDEGGEKYWLGDGYGYGCKLDNEYRMGFGYGDGGPPYLVSERESS